MLKQSMHCWSVSHFNQKLQQKTINIMSLVDLDFECIKNKRVKELGSYKSGQTVQYSFHRPKKFKQHLNLLDVQSIFIESIAAVVMKILLSFKKSNDKNNLETEFLEKG